jgi:hypothetical protein
MKHKRLGLVLALGAAGLLFASGASAAKATTKCQMTFALSGWSVIYQTANGTGRVTCANGQTMKVKLFANGGGLSVGKYKITDGHGKFTHVTNISDIIGTYAEAKAHVGVVHSGHAAALTKGDISLTLTGKGHGWDIGAGLGSFTIHRAD